MFKFFSGPFQEWSRVYYKGTAQVCIPLIRFLLYSFVSSSVLFLLRYSFLFFYLSSQLPIFWSISRFIIIYSLRVFHISVSILAVLNSAVVWMVCTHPPTSKSFSPFNNPLVTVLKAPITIGIFITFMFHSFFYSLAKSRYLSFFSHSFSFILWSDGTAKSTILQILFLIFSFFFFLFIIIRSGLLAEIRWSVCMSKFQWSLFVSLLLSLSLLHRSSYLKAYKLRLKEWITVLTP